MPRTSTIEAVTPERVRSAVAAFLGVEPDDIDATTPLTAYGIDSLGALQLVAELEDRFGRPLPESLLTDCPDLEQIVEVVSGSRGTELGAAFSRTDRMLADSRLPNDIRPWTARPARAAATRALLTGATGFLGASLLRSLIDAGLHVVCLVRATTDAEAERRVRENLHRYGLLQPTDTAKWTAVGGDLEAVDLGISSEVYQRFAADIDLVYHAAADVNWVSGYDALHRTNVAGTTALLRLASTGTCKPFHFVSSLSVCLAHEGPPVVDERTDMLPYVDRLPLGYAQSKAVAESLVRGAAAVGLPARIYRPTLIAGHSVSGASNPDDLICALLRGCIQMGAAPDLAWTFDAVPVDTAADAIVRLSRSRDTALDTFHLRHPRPRHWRECVLWAGVFGYRIRLLPYEAWLERLHDEARSADHALHRFRAFFTRRVHGLTAPEHFEEHRRGVVDCTQTRAAELMAGVSYPVLDAERLDTYLNDLVRRGFLPPPVTGHARREPGTPARANPDDSIPRGDEAWPQHVEPLLRGYFGDSSLRVGQIEVLSRGSENSIISELTSWRRGRRTGLVHCRLALDGAAGASRLELMAKVKPPDEDVVEVAETTAAVVDDRVRSELTAVRDRIGIRGSHLREIAIYRMQSDPRFGRHMPACYGAWEDEAARSWGLLLERLDGVELTDASPRPWSDEHLAAAIDGIAEIHGAWLGREQELATTPWIGYIPSAAAAPGMVPFWSALARHAEPMFTAWAGRSLAKTHLRLADTAPEWWPALERLPRTLIHHDFNPRNLAIRRTDTDLRLAAYDWELATVGAPQRDLAELLCFTLPERVHVDVVEHWVERHRAQLERQSGTSLPRAGWVAGFAGALADLLVSRLAFYALIHRIRPQSFLPRVVSVWAQLFEVYRGRLRADA